MKILFIAAHLRRGGPVDVIFNLCSKLLYQKDIEVELLTLRKEGSNSKIEEFSKIGIPVHQLNFSYLECEVLTLKVTRRIQSIINSLHVDIIHCHGYHPVVACARITNVFKCSTLHNRVTEDFANAFGKIWGSYMIIRYLHCLKKFHKNIAVSVSGAEYYEKMIPHVTYVNNGIDISKFYPLALNEQEEQKKKLYLSTNKLILVYSGRVEKEKRVLELVKWFVNQERHFDFILLILGDGSQLEECKKIADKNVVCTGRISNVSNYLQCADFYISNSKSEGMSLAACEAIACGLFPILSSIPSHQDVARNIKGILFESLEDVSLDQLYKKGIEERNMFHSYIDRNFSISVMVDAYCQVYKQFSNRI